jgi:hypothetical protein
LIWGHTQLAETLMAHSLIDVLDLSIHPVFAGHVLSSKDAGVSITDASALPAVIAGGLYLTTLALAGLGFGAIFRLTAGAITAFIGVTLVLPTLVTRLPNPWGRDIAQWIPANAGQALLSTTHEVGAVELHPWVGFAVLCAWAVSSVALAGWLITRRDA